MCHTYHYTFPCGHREYLSSDPCDIAFAVDLAAQLHVSHHPNTSLDLGDSGYSCPLCNALLCAAEEISASTSTAADKQSTDSQSPISPPSQTTIGLSTVLEGTTSRRNVELLTVRGVNVETGSCGVVARNWADEQLEQVVAETDEDFREEAIRTLRMNEALGEDSNASSTRRAQSVDRRAEKQGGTVPGSRQCGVKPEAEQDKKSVDDSDEAFLEVKRNLD